MSEEIVPGPLKITYIRTALRARTWQHTPAEQMLHILGQPGSVLCGILTPSILMIHVVMLQEERHLIPQPQIQHIVSQIKEMAIGFDVLQPDIAIH